MRILVIGAGAIGGYMGGMMAHNGQDIGFLCRPKTAAELRKHGLQVRLPDTAEEIFTRGLVFEAPAEAFTGYSWDVVVIAVKSYDTAAAVEPLLPFREQIPAVLCLQNGVENEAYLGAQFGEGRVIPGTVLTAVSRPAANRVVVEKFRGFGVAGPHPLAEKLVQRMDAAGLRARYFEDGPGMKWSKLLTNQLANPTSAILDMTPAAIFGHPGLFRLEMRQLRETLAVMDRLGAQVVDLPGTPVRMLAFAIRHLPAAVARPLLARAVGRGRGDKMPSLHIDLHSGSGRSEVEAYNGAVVRFGEQAGVPTPVNRLLTETLTALTRKEIPAEDFAGKPGVLLEKLAAYGG